MSSSLIKEYQKLKINSSTENQIVLKKSYGTSSNFYICTNEKFRRKWTKKHNKQMYSGFQDKVLTERIQKTEEKGGNM